MPATATNRPGDAPELETEITVYHLSSLVEGKISERCSFLYISVVHADKLPPNFAHDLFKTALLAVTQTFPQQQTESL